MRLIWDPGSLEDSGFRASHILRGGECLGCVGCVLRYCANIWAYEQDSTHIPGRPNYK
jgi:predicted metal-binding protein